MNRKRETLIRIAFLLMAMIAFPAVASAQAGVFSIVTSQTPVAVVDKEVTIYGVKIHYVEAGSGPVVILVHGLGGNTSNWSVNIPALAAKYRVIALDQIGFGKSDKPMINYQIATFVDFLDAFRKQLRIERASFVGNSMGGWVVASYAIAHPDRLERLVLVDAAGLNPGPQFDMSQLRDLNPSTREGTRRIASRVFYNKQLYLSDAAIDLFMTQRMTAGDGYTIKSLTDSIARGDEFLDAKLSAIKAPTLILWGRDDGLVPLADGERYNKGIAGSQLVVFDQCGHVPNLEKTAEFNAALLKFLAPGN